MSWIQRVGRYAGYKAANYIPKGDTICLKTLHSEIEAITKGAPKPIPSIINGRKFYYSDSISHVSPAYGNTPIYDYSYLKKDDYHYLNNFEANKKHWKNVPFEQKFDIFERIADLVENKYFYKLMATTMVGQGKNILEAELDCIAETVDFLRFNIQYTTEIIDKQPIGDINYSQYLPLYGRVAAITPFNFTAIAANLSTAPLYFGNSVFWKPSEKSLLSNYLFYQICLEAGIPPEVLHFTIMKPDNYIKEVIRSRCGGILFTGSTDAFVNILGNVDYKNHFPRIMGETGGKNFHFVDESADMDLVVEKTYQSAYGYAGQKCSACSILYLPDHKLPMFTEKFKKYHEIHHPLEKENYCLIDQSSYDRTVDVIEKAKNNNRLKLLMGGNYNNDNGYYIEPTLYHVNMGDSLLSKELFAPILIVKTYSSIFTNMAMLDCHNNSDYKLTGAIFGTDPEFIDNAASLFEGSCGNFYINDKSTGSVVGQQPFGGFCKSGTNDKAGDLNFMMRLFTQRNIKNSSQF